MLLRRNANAIFSPAAIRNGYELTRVHGVDVAATPAKELSARKVYSDAILADFVTGRHATHAVLTVYRPYPYADGRPELFGASYADIEGEVRREVLAGIRSARLEGGRHRGCAVVPMGPPDDRHATGADG